MLSTPPLNILDGFGRLAGLDGILCPNWDFVSGRVLSHHDCFANAFPSGPVIRASFNRLLYDGDHLVSLVAVRVVLHAYLQG